MILMLVVGCTFRTMVGASVSDFPTQIPAEKPNIQISTQHYLFLPAGPSFKGQWSEDDKQLSMGVGVGLIDWLPQRSEWFMNPPTIGVQLLEWHEVDSVSHVGTLSPFVQITAPPICVGFRTCMHSLSPFVEYEYSNIIGRENQHNWTLGLYWSPSN